MNKPLQTPKDNADIPAGFNVPDPLSVPSVRGRLATRNGRSDAI